MDFPRSPRYRDIHGSRRIRGTTPDARQSMVNIWVSTTDLLPDIGSIVLQAAGGGDANGAGTDQAMVETGNNIIIADIAFQVTTMSVCGFLALDFFSASRKHLREDFQGEAVTEKPQRKVWLILPAEIAAYITVLIRCIYRLPEMAGGWGNGLMQNEMEFLVLDGMMIALACLVFTVVHPGLYLPTMGTGRSHR
ncbi:hypothetical protein N7455_000068 [Penicillium solitum]|uniref:uncharacterized protein n=1 Tax=Penicillium solitum TaxID=60172 RepID=UPI0017C10927|nr:hypothetical protein HAV15_002528 [Penicillium sp. str. \